MPPFHNSQWRNQRGGGRGGADLTEQYRNNQRQNRLSDSFVPFLNFKLTRPQRGGWLATQSTPGSAPDDNEFKMYDSCSWVL